MAIVKRSPLFQSLLLASVISLAACGGGGGKKRDTTPDSIAFAPSTNAATSAVITSPAVTVSGINTSTPVSISGGEYSINGGAFTAAAGTVTNGQTLAVRITASDKTNTPKEATLTVGSVSAKFIVTTAADVTPDAFTFTAKTEAAVNTEYTSDPITVKGIDIAVPVSIAGGTYSINGGAYTAAAGTVSADQTITVKATSGSDTETTQNAVLTVGGVTGTFAITTVADTTPPVAEFKFPTPYTMSEANEVKVRGIATDDHAITEVKLVVRSFNLAAPDVTIETKEVIATPKSEANGVKDFSSWTATIPLTATAENEIKVIATDDRENEIAIEQANKVVIRQADVKSAFPDEVNQFDLESNLLFDNYDGRNRILAIDGDQIVSFDISTNQSVTLIDDECDVTAWNIDPMSKHIFIMCDEGVGLKEYDLETGHEIGSYEVNGISTVRAMSIDRSNGRAQLVMVGDADHGTNWVVTGFSLTNKNFSVISNDEQSPEIQSNDAVIVNGDDYLLPGGRFDSDVGGQIVSVSAIDGTRKIVSNNSIGSGDEYSGYLDEIRTAFLSGAVIDKTTNNLIAIESWTNKLFSINLDTFDRKIISDFSYKNESTKRYISSSDLRLDEESGRLYLADNRRQSLLIIDKETGEKVILSKSKNNF